MKVTYLNPEISSNYEMGIDFYLRDDGSVMVASISGPEFYEFTEKEWLFLVDLVQKFKQNG
jgi:hypothetical protein